MIFVSTDFVGSTIPQHESVSIPPPCSIRTYPSEPGIPGHILDIITFTCRGNVDLCITSKYIISNFISPARTELNLIQAYKIVGLIIGK